MVRQRYRPRTFRFHRPIFLGTATSCIHTGLMTSTLAERVINRLTATGAATETWSLVVLAALEGHKQLDSYLDDGLKVAVPPVTPSQGNGTKPEPPGVYLASITVEGFRGVGPSTTLQLRPGPGLTLVVGRNGSGKSSFAEGLEFLLTGSQLSLGEAAEGLGRRLEKPAPAGEDDVEGGSRGRRPRSGDGFPLMGHGRHRSGCCNSAAVRPAGSSTRVARLEGSTGGLPAVPLLQRAWLSSG